MIMENESRLQSAKRRAREELIAYVQASSDTRAEGILQMAFKELFEASGCVNRIVPEIEEMSRSIVARGVVIDCIHALSHEQVQKAERVAMKIATTF